MTTTMLLQQVKTATINKAPMVVLPMNLWSEIEDKLEDLAMLDSKKLKKDIELSRQQIRSGKIIPLADL